MLVCPHCQFENPDANNFCQNCGESLTDKPCPHCGDLTPLDTTQCPHCGYMTGTLWQAILAFPFPDRLSNGHDSAAIEAPQIVESADAIEQPGILVLTNGKYLDAQQRYQLLDLSPLPNRLAEVETKVLDCQPLQPSLLEVLYQHQGSDLASNSLQTTTIPTIAQSYIALQEQYPSLPLPKVHDAWEQNGLSIVLLEDRANLPLLTDACQNDEVLPLQILHWLHEIVEHWAALAPHHYGQSLLEPDNLRVDSEDYVLCLQRLYADRPDQPPSLKDLGLLWQTLFEQSQRTQNGNIFLLCRDLQSGAIASIDELRSRIESIATTLQPTAMIPAPASDLSLSVDNQSLPLLVDVDEDDIASENDDQPTIVLPMRLINLEDAGRTITGRQRDHNEDCFYIRTASQRTETKQLDDSQDRTVQAKGLYILCDGMGGHDGGEVASALAVETLRTYFDAHWHDTLPNEASIREAIRLTNQAIYDQNQQGLRSGSGRMGTTLVLLLLQDTEVAIAHVGDSRLYRYSRRQGLEQLTTDHEVGQREIQRGVEPAIAYARPDAYQLTQALGPRDENFIHPDVKFLEANEDMLLILASDGLTDNDFLELHGQEPLQSMLSGQIDLDQGVNQLVEDANQFSGHDNITVVAVRIQVRPNYASFKPRSTFKQSIEVQKLVD
ncbi:serine/threonine phosphatase [Thermocoleostomius sinensis]|uniref:Serine/threonine phosphatase n=1 Tax=Thermocoleostomius sinensis A174 TaxID=2016057 RepID=A0A9E8ZAF5_9CYAN|nr:serine/threonine phosphatase [Thermocoleostomius sinensis]WAL58364.1 serine/threonine phosphatase [Thermocoleostomius sinensis A174]